MRKSAVVIVALLAVAAVQIAYYAPRLPETVASHFNAAGIPNSWEPKQLFLELYVVILLSVTAVYVLVPRLIGILPVEMINLPNKNYWLAPERHATTIEYFLDHFAIFGAGTLVLLVTMFQLCINANLLGQTNFPSVVAMLFAAAYLVFVVTWVTTLFLRFRRV